MEVRVMNLLLTIAAVVFVLWLIGLAAHIAGGFINLLLVLAIVLFIASFFGGRGAHNNY
jgi:hypothetical protein